MASPEIEAVHSAIGTTIKTGWAALALDPAIPLVPGNKDFDPDADPVARTNGFVEYAITFAGSFPLEIGSGGSGGGAWRGAGQVFVSAFTKAGTGEQEAWKRVGLVEGILRPSRPLSIVRWSRFDKQPGGASGEWFMAQLAAAFEYEYTST